MVDAISLQIWNVIEQTQRKFDFIVFCEHDLGGRQTSEVHIGRVVENLDILQNLREDFSDHRLRQSGGQVQEV